MALLTRHLATFPADLRTLFRVASGIAEDAPFLEARLGSLEDILNRSPRVLRRRLRQAEQLLADAIAQERGVRDSLTVARGWQWVTQELHLTVGEGAVLDLNRTMLALDDHQKFIGESFYMPRAAATDTVEVEAVAGIDEITVNDEVPGRWALTLSLPHELRVGQEFRTQLRVRISRARMLAPYLVFSPVRPTRRARVTVDFGAPPGAARAWLVDGVLPLEVPLADPARRYADLSDGRVSLTVDQPQIGLAYGVGWDWPTANGSASADT